MGKIAKLKSTTALVPVSSLDAIASKIADDIARQDKSRADWIDATADLCLHLAEARAKFKDNASFGNWFDGTGIGLNKNDRAAAIAMGEELERAKTVLQNTERRSLRHIHDKEFRFPHVGKTTSLAKPKNPVTIEGELVPEPKTKADRAKPPVTGDDETVALPAGNAGTAIAPEPRAHWNDDSSERLMEVMLKLKGGDAASAVEAAPPPEPTPEPQPVAPEIIPAVNGMLPLADVELHLGDVIASLDRLAKRDGTPAIRAIADDLRDLIAGWRGEIADEEIPSFLKKTTH